MDKDVYLEQYNSKLHTKELASGLDTSRTLRATKSFPVGIKRSVSQDDCIDELDPENILNTNPITIGSNSNKEETIEEILVRNEPFLKELGELVSKAKKS